MTKTTNYQLNQWAKSDRIMMDDFNADNAKIDAALKANADAIAETAAAFPLVKLKDVTLGAGTQNWSIDVSDIDFTQYARILVLPKLTGNSTDTILRFDQITTGYCKRSSSGVDGTAYISSFSSDIMDPRIEFWCNSNRFCSLTCRCASSGCVTEYYYLPLSSLGQTGPAQLTFSKSNGSITGGRLLIYGLR